MFTIKSRTVALIFVASVFLFSSSSSSSLTKADDSFQRNEDAVEIFPSNIKFSHDDYDDSYFQTNEIQQMHVFDENSHLPSNLYVSNPCGDRVLCNAESAGTMCSENTVCILSANQEYCCEPFLQ